MRYFLNHWSLECRASSDRLHSAASAGGPQLPNHSGVLGDALFFYGRNTSGLDPRCDLWLLAKFLTAQTPNIRSSRDRRDDRLSFLLKLATRSSHRIQPERAKRAARVLMIF